MLKIQVVLLAFVTIASLHSHTHHFRINPVDGLTYILIPPGRYTTGCLPGDNQCIGWERHPATVTIARRFWIGRTEVTEAAWRRVMKSNPSLYKGADLPVERVSWSDASTYCHRVGMRLPTESEWEYAAYGGKTALPSQALSSIAWYDPNSDDRTHPVAKKLPNGFGLYDVLGNVWEWVGDIGTAPEGRVLKGGSFYNSSRDLRVSDRLGAPGNLRHRDIGFRCAATRW